MSDSELIIDEIRQQLTTFLPDRVITGNWQDREDYLLADRQKGIHCILYRGENPGGNIYQGTLKLLIYGMIELGNKAKGSDVEAQELQLVKELKTYSQSDTGGLLAINSIVTSMQVEVPCGWYFAECDYGPVDLSVVDDRWDDGSEPPDDVYVGLDPDIGIGHEDDYIPMDGVYPAELRESERDDLMEQPMDELIEPEGSHD